MKLITKCKSMIMPLALLTGCGGGSSSGSENEPISKDFTVPFPSAPTTEEEEIRVPVLCGPIDDSDQNNATGACIKIAQGLTHTAHNKYFSSAPSIAFITSLGYVEQNNAENDGRSYADNQISFPPHDPENGDFARFRQDGLHELNNGQYGQFDRYCKDLAALELAGQSNWRRPSEHELLSFLHENINNGGIYNKFGFPSTGVFLTYQVDTPGHLVGLTGVSFSGGTSTINKLSVPQTAPAMGMCVSEIETP